MGARTEEKERAGPGVDLPQHTGCSLFIGFLGQSVNLLLQFDDHILEHS